MMIDRIDYEMKQDLLLELKVGKLRMLHCVWLTRDLR